MKEDEEEGCIIRDCDVCYVVANLSWKWSKYAGCPSFSIVLSMRVFFSPSRILYARGSEILKRMPWHFYSVSLFNGEIEKRDNNEVVDNFYPYRFILLSLSLSAKPIVDNLIIFLLIGYREKTASFVTRATSIDRIIVLRSKTLRFESPSSPTSSLDSLSMVTVRDSFYTDRYRSLVSPLLLLQISYRNVCVQA